MTPGQDGPVGICWTPVCDQRRLQKDGNQQVFIKHLRELGSASGFQEFRGGPPSTPEMTDVFHMHSPPPPSSSELL